MSYLNLNIEDFCKQLSSNNGQDMQEAVWDLILQSKEPQVFLNIVSRLESYHSNKHPDLAMRFLKESFKQIAKHEQ